MLENFMKISCRVNNKQLLKNYNKIWKKSEKLMKINFESKPVCGDDDKYIKTKVKTYADSMITNFHKKKCQKKSTMQMFVNNNDRFSY